MKSLLAKISVCKFVGLYIGEREISVSEVGATPLGPVRIRIAQRALPPQ